MTTTPTSGAADLPEALINIAREIEALKRDCGMDPESAIAIQNGRYMAISYKVRALAAGQAAAAQGVVQDDLITIRKPTTSAELLWLLKLAHLVISDVDKTLEETFSPAQPAAEASRFGSPELQAMIIARCVEKDQADSVQEDAALLDWLEQHDGRYYNLDKVAAIVGTGFLVRSEGNMPQVHSTLREAVYAARKQGASHD